MLFRVLPFQIYSVVTGCYGLFSSGGWSTYIFAVYVRSTRRGHTGAANPGIFGLLQKRSGMISRQIAYQNSVCAQQHIGEDPPKSMCWFDLAELPRSVSQRLDFPDRQTKRLCENNSIYPSESLRSRGVFPSLVSNGFSYEGISESASV